MYQIYIRIICKIWTGKNDRHNTLTTAQVVVSIWSIVSVRPNLVVLAKQFNLKIYLFQYNVFKHEKIFLKNTYTDSI